MSREAALEAVAGECCRVFLGWRLREDRDALLALGEGRLEIDLLREEAWCDGEPLPSLFIAGAVHEALVRSLEGIGVELRTLDAAQLDAEFARRDVRLRGKTKPSLQATCRVSLRVSGVEYAANMHNMVDAQGSSNLR